LLPKTPKPRELIINEGIRLQNKARNFLGKTELAPVDQEQHCEQCD